MLRITILGNDAASRLKLEGKLAGAWVPELEHCCCGPSCAMRHKDLVIDLTDVEFVDNAGKSLLRMLHEHGARFIASTLTMRELVREITATPNGGSSI